MRAFLPINYESSSDLSVKKLHNTLYITNHLLLLRRKYE
jgi:hypothetical protein